MIHEHKKQNQSDAISCFVTKSCEMTYILKGLFFLFQIMGGLFQIGLGLSQFIFQLLHFLLKSLNLLLSLVGRPNDHHNKFDTKCSIRCPMLGCVCVGDRDK